MGGELLTEERLREYERAGDLVTYAEARDLLVALRDQQEVELMLRETWQEETQPLRNEVNILLGILAENGIRTNITPYASGPPVGTFLQ